MAIGVPLPSQPQNFWGWMKDFRPVSSSGLRLMIRAPRWRFASCRAGQHAGVVGARVLAADQDQSACRKSSRVTAPLPMPITSFSATPLDSWHMLEQSGRLLVPNARTNSW